MTTPRGPEVAQRMPVSAIPRPVNRLRYVRMMSVPLFDVPRILAGCEAIVAPSGRLAQRKITRLSVPGVGMLHRNGAPTARTGSGQILPSGSNHQTYRCVIELVALRLACTAKVAVGRSRW